MIIIDLFVRPRIIRWPWRGDRVADGARLESECAPQGYRGFESLPLRSLSYFKNEDLN